MKMTGPKVKENKMEEKSEKRLFVGGLFPDVKPEDLCQRFAQYGTIKGTEIKIRKDDDGLPVKIFAYIDLETTNAELRKCMNAYKKARWHGRELKVEIAKDNFMKRLERERQEMVDEREKQRATALESGIQRQGPSLSDKATAGNFNMRGATPGTKVPGQENWIVGKYGRVLPVVNLKKKGSSRLLKVDPSKLTHNVRKIKDENNSDNVDPGGLTWQLDEKEISRKRKGEFPEWRLPQSKRKHNENGDQNEIDVRQRLMTVVESDRKYRNTDFEVVPFSGKTGTQLTDGKSENKVTDLNRFDSDTDDSDNSNDVGGSLDLSRFNSDSDNEVSDFGQNRTWSEQSNKSLTQSIEENQKKWKTQDSFSSLSGRKIFGIPNFVDEYASGLTEVFDSGNVSVDGRDRNTASDGDDDDFEAFVKKELKKVELQRSKPISTIYSQKVYDKPLIDTQKGSYAISSINNQCSGEEQTAAAVSDEIKARIIEGKKTLPAFRGTKFLSSERSISCSLGVDKNSLSIKEHPKTLKNVLIKNMTPVMDKHKLPNTSTKVKTEQKPYTRPVIPSHIVKPKLLLDEFSSGLEATDSANINDSSEDAEDDEDSDFEEFVKRESEKIKSENRLVKLTVNTKAGQQSYENSKTVEESLLEPKNVNYNSSSSSESEDSPSPVQIYKVSKDLMTEKHGIKKNILGSKAYASHSSSENDAHDDSDDEDDSDNVDNEDGLVEVDDEDDSEETADEDDSEEIADEDDLDEVAKDDSEEVYDEDDLEKIADKDDSEKIADKDDSDDEDDSEKIDDSDDEDDSEKIADEGEDDSEKIADEDDSDEVDDEDIGNINHNADDDMDSGGSDFEALVSKAVQEVKNTGSLDLQKCSASLNSSIQHKEDLKAIRELGASKDIRLVNNSETKNLHLGKKRLTLGGIGDISESSDSDDDTDIESESSVKDTEERSSFSTDTGGKNKSYVISKTIREKLEVSSIANKNDILQDNALKQTDVKSAESAVKVVKLPVFKNGTTTTKTRQASNTKAEHGTKSSRAEDKAVVDKKRLEAVKQRHRESMAQKSAIKCALSNLDVKKKVNTKIVFDSDNEEDQIAMKMNENKPNSSEGNDLFEEQKTKSKSLFDSDDEDDVSDVKRFGIREEFEGEEGRKLAKLQARFGHDERFKLDARFIESGSEDDEEEKMEEEDETTRSMKILQSVVGARAVGGLHKQDKAKKKFKDIGALKYDPSREEHQQFEVKNQQIEEPKVEGNKKKKKKKSADATSEEEPEVVVPEVSAERFHEISDSLKRTFVAKDSDKTSIGAGFSFLAAFGKQESKNKSSGIEDSAIPIPSSLRTNQLSLDNRFNVRDDGRASDSDMEVDNTHENTTGGESETDFEEQSTDQAPTVTQSRTFFFFQNDKFCKDGVTQPNKPGTDSTKADWFQKRRHLIASYKSKHKNFRRKKGRAGHKRGGKR